MQNISKVFFFFSFLEDKKKRLIGLIGKVKELTTYQWNECVKRTLTETQNHAAGINDQTTTPPPPTNKITLNTFILFFGDFFFLLSPGSNRRRRRIWRCVSFFFSLHFEFFSCPFVLFLTFPNFIHPFVSIWLNVVPFFSIVSSNLWGFAFKRSSKVNVSEGI